MPPGGPEAVIQLAGTPGRIVYFQSSQPDDVATMQAYLETVDPEADR